MTDLKSQFEEIVHKIQQVGFEAWATEHSVIVATKAEYPYPDEPDIAHLYSPTLIYFDDEIWTATYAVGQRNAFIRVSKNMETVIQGLLNFYEMSERNEDTLRTIAEILFRLQDEGFLAEIDSNSQIMMSGRYPHIKDYSFIVMLEAFKLGDYPVKHRIIKETTGWSVVTLPALKRSRFNSLEEATEYLLSQPKA